MITANRIQAIFFILCNSFQIYIYLFVICFGQEYLQLLCVFAEYVMMTKGVNWMLSCDSLFFIVNYEGALGIRTCVPLFS